MKTILFEYLGITIVLIVGVLYVNHEIDALIVRPVPIKAQTGSPYVTAHGTSFNSDTDMLQSSAGTNVFQDQGTH